MKLSTALLAAGLGLASAKKQKSIDLGKNIKADSKMGSALLSKARKLENADEEADFTWVVDYSIKFQGCHHIDQWNEEADGEDEPKIQTKRLIRFRLCPTDTCLYEDASGCDSGYGDYIIDLNTFLQAYWQNKQEWEEWNCENYENNVCDCENANNEDYCRYDCYVDNGLDYCIEENPYEDDQGEEEEEFEVDRYLECGEWEIPENNNRKGRKLEDEDDQYFVGPYCSDQGGKVYLGVFSDEFCTNFVTDDDGDEGYHLDFYKSYTGKSLPYSEESLVDMKCLSCKELEDNDANQDDGDAQDEDEVIEMCEELYEQAGKCEGGLYGVVQYPNDNACDYMEGIKIIRKDGVIVTRGGAKSTTAAALIGVFAISTVLLGAYVYYLKTKLDRAKINLTE